MIDINLLLELTSLNGISGFEESVREYIKAKIAPFCNEVFTDNIGNLIAFKKGKHTCKEKFLVAAHMDEVGFICTSHTDDGFVKIANVGSIDARIALGKIYNYGNDEKAGKGVINLKAIHMTTMAERETVPKISDLVLDIGSSGKAEAEGKIARGDQIFFENNFAEFGEDMIRAKALDDRVGCALMIELIKQDLNFDTWFAFTVQEEIGLRGAIIAANKIEPSLAIVLECTTAADLPEIKGASRSCEVGKGVAISLLDGRTVFDDSFRREVQEIAKNNNIPFQYRTSTNGGNDAGQIFSSREGCRTCTLSVPTRYIHSPNSVCNKNDIDSAFKLVLAVINNGGIKNA